MRTVINAGKIRKDTPPTAILLTRVHNLSTVLSVLSGLASVRLKGGLAHNICRVQCRTYTSRSEAKKSSILEKVKGNLNIDLRCKSHIAVQNSE